MALTSRLYSALKEPGFATPLLAADLGILLMIVFLSKALIVPVVVKYRRAKRLDQLAGTSPKHWFYGHLQDYSFTEEGLYKFARLTLSFPTMFNEWLAPFLSELVLHHADTAVSLLSSNGTSKNHIGYKFLRPWIGDGLLTSNGKKWHRNRHLLTPAFHFSVLKGYTQDFNECAEVMLRKWDKTLGVPVEVAEDVSLMTLDTILKCSMSTVTECQDSREKHPYIKAVRDLAQLTATRLDKTYLLPDFIFWKTSYGKSYKEAANVVHTHAEKVIAERRQHIKTLELSGTKPTLEQDGESFFQAGQKRLDFLDILLQTRDDEGKGLSDREIRDEVDTFLFEGHDTTASGISWALYNLAKYPEYQEKCRKEVEAVLDGREFIEWNDFHRFQYLSMFIKESLRLYPPVVAIGRELEKPLTLRSALNKPEECVIPSQNSASLIIFALHRNPQLWRNPEEFDPERFTKENISKRHSHAYLPFSAGSRNCIGQHFAMNEMKTALAQTLRRYRLYLDEETPAPKMQPRLILQSAQGIFIKFERLH